MQNVKWVLLLLILSGTCWASVPEITSIPDQHIQQGQIYLYQPELTTHQDVLWAKTFGPDDIDVDPSKGTVSWSIPANLPDESFHIGVKAINSEGAHEETWILTVGDGNVVYIGPAEAITTLKDGMAAIEPGDTLVMRNGHWSHDETNNTIPGHGNKFQFLEGGDETQYTTLIAEDPGQVIIDGDHAVRTIHVFGSYPHPDWSTGTGSSFDGNTSYFAIKGLVLINSAYEALKIEYSHHVKLVDIGIGPSAKGESSYANVYIYQSRYVLIEGLYAWGHGRYKIQFQRSSEGVVRRSIVRIDDYDGNRPLGGYLSYCSRNITYQNNIMVDSDQSNYWMNHYEITNAFGVAATDCYDWPRGIEFKRSLSINTHMGLMKADVRNTDEIVLWENIVGWDMKPDRQAGGTGGGVPILSGVANTNTNKVTIGDVLLNGGDGADFYLYSRIKDSIVQNSIFYRLGWDGQDITDRGEMVRNSATRFQFANNNVHGFIGGMEQASPIEETGTMNHDPEFKYVTMLPRDSQLRTLANDGGRMGAEVMTLLGQSGTHYGDDGFDIETHLPMWPLPIEEIAHQHMSAFRLSGVDRNGEEPGITGERGFALPGETLTNYIWSYLGNPPPPFNVSAIPQNQQVKLMWEPPAEISQEDITGFNIYQLIGHHRELKASVEADAFSATVTGLNNNENYEFVVTSVKQENNESDYGYAVTSTPAPGLRPNAPVLTIQ